MDLNIGVCPYCDEDPSSHSFYHVGKTTTGRHILYTCVSKATRFRDRQSVLLHFGNMLDRLNGEDWVWMFDLQGFGSEHALQIKIATRLVQLIQGKYGSHFQKVYFIKPTWHFQTLITLLNPFMSRETRDKFETITTLDHLEMDLYRWDMGYRETKWLLREIRGEDRVKKIKSKIE